jgi:hypothetical protein
MGGKGSKSKDKKPGGAGGGGTGTGGVVIPPKPSGPTDSDYEFLASQTGLSKNEIKSIYDQFMTNNPDGQLDKREFVRLYNQVNHDSPMSYCDIAVPIKFPFNMTRCDPSRPISWMKYPSLSLGHLTPTIMEKLASASF